MRAKARPVGAALSLKRLPHVTLKMELQCKLRQPRIADMQDLAERATLVRDVAIDRVKLCVIPNVEEVGPKFHRQPLSQFGLLGKANIPVVDARTTAERTRRIADRAQRHGGVSHQVWIEDVTGDRLASGQSRVKLLCQRTSEGSAHGAARVYGLELCSRGEVRLARLFEVKGRVQQFHVILRG